MKEKIIIGCLRVRTTTLTWTAQHFGQMASSAGCAVPDVNRAHISPTEEIRSVCFPIAFRITALAKFNK